MIDRATYETRLAARFIPAAIIATRPSTGHRAKDGWSRGKDRNLAHNCWLIATSDPLKKRLNVHHVISFDAAVDFPGILLSDNSLNGDRLTKKILILECLTLGPTGNGSLDATSVSHVSHKFDWLLRHRLAEGYASFSAISVFFASDFSKLLRIGGVLALVPIEERLTSLLERADTHEPLVVDGWLARQLGVTTAALANSSEFRQAVFEAAHDRGLDTSLLVPENESRSDEAAIDSGTRPKRRVSETPKVHKSLRNYLEILALLFRLSDRDLHHDRMTRDPFSETSLEAIVKRDGKEGGRTETLVPGDMMRVLTAAARFIATYSEYILASLRDNRRIKKAGVVAIETSDTLRLMPPGGVRILPVWNLGAHGKKPLPPKTILMSEAIRHLFSSCAILIAGFAARRDIGVRSAHYGCMSGNESLLEMSIYIGKSDKDRVNIPVPGILGTVVKVLEELSADTRRAKGTQWLFEVAYDPMDPITCVTSRFSLIFNDFLEFAGIEPPEGKEHWNLRVHMLRRAYGIWYYHGLRGGSADALSLLYRHNDPHMTRTYFTMILPGQINQLKTELDARLRSSISNRTREDKDWIDRAADRLAYLKTHHQSFDEPRCELFVEKMIGLWRGTESVIGLGGKALFNDVQAIAERAMGSVRIGSRANDPSAVEAPLLERLVAYANSHFLEPVIGTNMWCVANPHDPLHRADAECLKLKGRAKAPWKKDGVPGDLMPDFAFACNRVCIGCRYGAAFEDGQLALSNEVEKRRYSVDLAATAALEDDGRRLLEELEADLAAAGPVQRGGAL